MSSPWRLQQAILALHAGRARLMEGDPDLTVDIAADLPEEASQVEAAIVAVCRAALAAKDLHEMAKKRAALTADRAKRFAAREEALRGVAFAAFDALGKRKVESDDLTVSVRAGRDTVFVTDEAKVPDEYFDTVTTRVLNKTKLAADVEAGVVVDGAALGNTSPSLVIKGS